jgi:DNA-binding SARP family transcriptional activator
MTLRLRTFGAVHLERDGTPLGGAHSQRRRLALLAYLTAADRPVIPRSRVLAILWPESDDASARHSLSQLLYALRQDLPAGAITADTETVRLDPAALPSDVHDFDVALRESRFEDAVAGYRGAFLDDFYVDNADELNRWIDEERGRRMHACARALDKLADRDTVAREWHRAVDWLRRRTALDPADSRSALRLMQALAEVGDRDGALRAARVYETIVRTELEAEPDQAVTRLVEELRRGASGGRVLHAATPPSPASAPIIERATSPVSNAEPLVARRRSRWLPAAVVAIALVALLITRQLPGVSSASNARRGSPNVTVVIGDLDGPDLSLTLAVREALRAELVNAKGVLLTSDLGIRELRTLMRLSPDSALRGQELVALATRSGADVAVTGSVVPVSEGAQIVVELLQPETGRSVRTFTARPENGPALLSAVERLARAIGVEISRSPHDSSAHPLPAVTTASLAALKSYAVARRTAAMGKRREAVEPGERAVTHDSAFVLAHYFLGDLLWFLDEQTHSEAHLRKAFELIQTVPPREQLVIRARYEQLVRDRPDSALAYWQLLHDASPGDVLAYEGRSWALRALGRHEEAAASADTAMTLDAGAMLPNITNAMYSWLAVGDTASAIAIAQRANPRYREALAEARYYAALFREPAAAIPWADSTRLDYARHWRRHLAQVARGDLADARITLDSVIADDRAQIAPNAMINQGWAALYLASDSVSATRLARQALAWMRPRDLSPPANGRLCERIADLAARAGDETTVRSCITLVHARDAGRSLSTYVLALRTLDATLAYARRQYAESARLAERARHGVYFSRSLATIALLEADAWRAAGERARGDSLAKLVSTHRIVDGHFEAWAMLQAVSRLRDEKRAVTASPVR